MFLHRIGPPRTGLAVLGMMVRELSGSGIISDETMVLDSASVAQALPIGLSSLPVRRIGRHEVKPPTKEGIVG